jgi:DNA modification methylase
MKTNTIELIDCIEHMNTMEDECLDLIMTSPPYFNAKGYTQYETLVSYMAHMRAVFLTAYCKLKRSHMCVINVAPIIIPRKSRAHQSYRVPLPFYFVPMMEEIGYEFLEDIIWKKPDGSARNRNGGFYRHRKPRAYKPNIITEYILIFKKPADFLIDKVLYKHSLVEDGYERTNVWEFNPETNSDHPAPFPIELPRNIIQYYSYENEVVYDPFMGSGTTALACLELNRKYIGSEINEEFYYMAIERVNSR